MRTPFVPRRLLACLAVLALGAAAVGVPSAAHAAAPTGGESSTAPCGGALLPAHFAITDGRPHETTAPYPDPTLYNPTSISIFTMLALEDARNSPQQQVCLAELGGTALLAGSVTRPVSGATARFYPYMFAFRANPSTPTLQPGWLSGLAQGGALNALASLYDVTKDASWLQAATETFESFMLPAAQGGVVTRDHGLTWLQEYPSSPPSYVLNGNNEALLSISSWATRTGDVRAARLFQDVLSSTEAELPKHSLAWPMGAVTSYDMLRGYPTAYVKAFTTGTLSVSSARVVTTSGATFAPLTVATGRPVAAGPNLTLGAAMPQPTTVGALPTGWSRLVVTSPSTVRYLTDSTGNGFVRTTSSGHGWEAFGQDVPSAKLVPGQSYRISFRSRLLLPTGTNGTSGRVTATARCPSGAVQLVDFGALRGSAWSTTDLMVRMPRTPGCGLRLEFYQNDWTVAGTVADYDDVLLTTPESAVGGMQPALPLSVVEDPTPRIEVRYSGQGWLGAWWQGRWYHIADLPAATDRTIQAALPERFAGRHVNLGYHQLHVLEMWALYKLTGDQPFKTFGLLWQRLAPEWNSLVFAPPSAGAVPSTPSDRLLDPGPGFAPTPPPAAAH